MAGAFLDPEPLYPKGWGGDVSHDWYWWGKEFGMFAERLFG